MTSLQILSELVKISCVQRHSAGVHHLQYDLQSSPCGLLCVYRLLHFTQYKTSTEDSNSPKGRMMYFPLMLVT